jgi:hypothetical protein
MDIRHGQGMAHNAPKPRDIGHLDQTLVLSNIVEQSLIGIDDSIGLHLSFPRNLPPVIIHLLYLDFFICHNTHPFDRKIISHLFMDSWSDKAIESE